MAMLIDLGRVQSILLQPGATWKAIDGEFTKPSQLYTSYILPLAAVGPICTAVGMTVFGLRIPLVGATFRVPITSALTQAAVQYVLAIVGVFVIQQIVNALAETFGGTKNSVQALKVAAYSSTAAWVAGAFNLIPALALVGMLVSLYSLYLLYAGLPVVMKAPKDRAMGYAIVVIIGVIVVFLIAGAVSAAFLPGYSELSPRV
jgi:hypothetical protein